MRGLLRGLSRQAGQAPGTVGGPRAPAAGPVRLRTLVYTADACEARDQPDAQACFAAVREGAVTWINVDGLHDAQVLQAVGARFGLHPLVLEDIANPSQRPRCESTEAYLFLTLKMLRPDPSGDGLLAEQVSLIVLPGVVVTFQEAPGDVFDPVRERIRTGAGRVRAAGADYLAYALLDAVVDQYFVLLEAASEQAQALEEAALGGDPVDFVRALQARKRELIALRRAVWPLREVLTALERTEPRVFEPATRPYLRDLYDHTIQAIDAVEVLRDVFAGVQDLHMTHVSNRMNEIMKVLTMIATVFIPLGFLAGVYGMNFERMWPVEAAWGFPALLGVMAALGLGMVVWFRRKRWL